MKATLCSRVKCRIRRFLGPVAICFTLISASSCYQALKLAAEGDSKQLRNRDGAPSDSKFPPLLILALDGVGRKIIYEELEAGHLPGLSKLLYGSGKNSARAYKSDRMLSVLPSTTMIAWASVFTGVTPGQHGLLGNEFFLRSERRYVAPVPVTIEDAAVAYRNFTEGYANQFKLVPTVYERMRAIEPEVRIWVAMHPIHAGADRLVLTNRGAYFEAFRAFLQEQATELVTQDAARALYAALDEEVIDTVLEQLVDGPVPDVLTVPRTRGPAIRRCSARGRTSRRRAAG
jgi:hypothetical protein